MKLARHFASLASVAAVLFLLLPLHARAQAPTPGFVMLGYLQELEVDDLNDPLSAGRLVVNGVPVVLPRNLYVTMPGQYLTLNDLFRGRRPGTAPALAPVTRPSGLALKDANKAPIPFEVDVVGNIVNGQYIAGVVHLTQQGLNAGAGFIRAIDYAKGELLVGPDAGGTPVARVRINDPSGVYGKRNADKTAGDVFDERFAVDPGNASVASNTGFPMCIPRTDPAIADDPACPRANRAPATGAFAASEGRRFTCGSVAAEPTAPSHAACQPARPAPLKEGDYIDFAGMLVEDSPGSGTYVHAAHAVQALTGIYTSPGANPAYVFTEEAIVGTLGDPWPGIDQEETSRFRIVGFSTDPSRRVDVFVVDNDGSERRLTTLQPSPVAQIGRIRITLPAKANFLPVTRDVRIRIEGQPEYTGTGIAQGQYTSPVGEYIAPENTRFGRPKSPVGAPFENFCFLFRGGEPLTTLGRSGPAIGPLVPFPASGHADSQRRADGSASCV